MLHPCGGHCCLRATIPRPTIRLVLVENRLALVDQAGWGHIELHGLVQVKVELWKLELLVELVCRYLFLILRHLVYGGRCGDFFKSCRVEHLHGALCQGLIHIDTMLLTCQVTLALLVHN